MQNSERRGAPPTPLSAESFSAPSAEFGPVPFWWWVGEEIDFERIVWQLDQLRAKGIRNAIISYNHHPDSTPNTGQPAVFSPVWWDLVRRTLDACRERDMCLSFQDYTLLNPILQEVGKANPDMAGGALEEVHWRGRLPATESIRLQVRGPIISARTYAVEDGTPQAASSLPATLKKTDSEDWIWKPERRDGEWLISIVFLKPNAFDPMHPLSGSRVIERFYSPLEKELGDHLGTTFPISFQDELDFGARMPMWSPVLAGEFQARKNYDLLAVLSALWHDLGPISPKVRIDYADVVVSLLEERYFIPIYSWHESRNLLFANDNFGRGGIEDGRLAYADAFRTMRWYSAPGTDDPSLPGPRAFKGLKVNSSIAHLYKRPRVWNECFHSSGWGTTPGAVLAALNEDFVYGATVVNLHGLYYSTLGGWWEWAPPDFHFRQPYWDHTVAMTQYATRLCQTLTVGDHVCDLAILYPITAIEGGLNPRRLVTDRGEIPVSEQQAHPGEKTFDAAEAAAFGLGRHLLSAGMDFDFIDFQSLERATVKDGRIEVSGESFRVLILPWMSAMRFSTLRVAAEFARQGGLVIAYGCRPSATERAGSCDPEVESIVRDLFGENGHALFVPEGYDQVKEAIQERIGRDFDPAGTGWMAVHRRAGAQDVYFVFNPGGESTEATASFRVRGSAELWDAWTGTCRAVKVKSAGECSQVRLTLERGHGALVVFDRDSEREGENPSAPTTHNTPERIALTGPWEFQLDPTMDNQFGDFRLPASSGFLEVEARTFRHAPEPTGGGQGWEAPDFDDADWSVGTFSFGQRFWKLGPLPPDTDTSRCELGLKAGSSPDPSVPVQVGGGEYFWQPHDLSLRLGIEEDPFQKDGHSGPHGLKGAVPDEFIDLTSGEPGAVWLLWTAAVVGKDQSLEFEMGSRSRYSAWLNGEFVLAQDEELPPGRYPVWNIQHYECSPKHRKVDLRTGANSLLLRFVEPAGQRLRAYAAFRTGPPIPTAEPTLKWFAQPDYPLFDPLPYQEPQAWWFRFPVPPGTSAFTVFSRARLQAWCDGLQPTAMPADNDQADGVIATRFVIFSPSPDPALVALRVDPQAGSYDCDRLPHPVRIACGPGRLRAGDWCEHGLATYSGAAWYRRDICLTAEEARRVRGIELGAVAATARVWLNGRELQTLIMPPWNVETPEGTWLCGTNRLEIHVANTLANHYSVGIPTPYVFPGQTLSGLLGPVHLVLSP